MLIVVCQCFSSDIQEARDLLRWSNGQSAEAFMVEAMAHLKQQYFDLERIKCDIINQDMLCLGTDGGKIYIFRILPEAEIHTSIL